MTSASGRARVLLIEDSPADARLIVETLKDLPSRPFALEHATLLSSGLEMLSTGEFELLLLDLGLPDSFGKDTLLKVRSLSPDLAVVVLTGLDDESLAAETVQLGAQDYLVKGDLDGRRLARVLRYAIERKQSETALREARAREQQDRQEERERIGMDLHDGVVQDIFAVSLALEVAVADLDRPGAGARETVEKAIDELHEIVGNIRSYIFDLRPRQFRGDLGTALTELTREFQQDSQIDTRIEVEPALPEFELDQGMTFYHIAHEALSNARRHAHPRTVAVSLRVEARLLVLEVRDDGSGFDTERRVSEEHRGMRNMASRAKGIGADLAVLSAPGAGTCVRLQLAIDPSAGALPSQAAA